MGVDGCVISGDWNPTDSDGVALHYDAEQLIDRLDALLERA